VVTNTQKSLIKTIIYSEDAVSIQ